MKRGRMLQVAVGLLGLFYVALIYPLYTDLAHSKWLLEMKNACDPMFLSWFIALGPFLLLAAKKPSSHRSLIAFAACQSLAHASVMTIQTVQAWKHGVHRDFTDVVVVGVIGGILLALTLEKRKQSALVTQSLPKHLYSAQDSGSSSFLDGWSANRKLARKKRGSRRLER